MQRIAAIIVLLITVSIQGKSQEDITLQLITPPGNELRIDESLRAIISNRSGEEFEVYLKGYVRESQDGMIFEGRSSSIELPERTTTLNRRNIDRFKPFETNFMDGDYESYVTRTSEFPPGEYEVCVQILLAADNRIIAEDCYNKVIEEVLPPSLISPDNRSKVTKSNPFFSWSPVTGSNSSSLTYTLQIVEISGNQSPVAAFQSNPAWFKQDNIRSPLFQYPLQARKLREKQAYAWKVEVYNGDKFISESEIWSFVYVKTDDMEDEDEEDGDEEEEEILIPEQYNRLNSEDYASFYLLNDYQLKFVYRNKYAPADIRCDIENTNRDIVASDVLNSKQHTGLNFNKLDLANRVQPGEVFHLRCTDPLGNQKSLRFKIRKESNNNIIEDFQLDGNFFDGLPDGILDGGG